VFGVAIAALLLAILGTPAFAQNYSGDARHIAMGSIGAQNAASELAGEKRRYRSIILPIGLYQIYKSRDIFDPGSDQFDPIRAMEFAASPLHYQVNRQTGSSGFNLVSDLIQGLNAPSGLGAVRDLIGRIQGPQGAALVQQLSSGNQTAINTLVQDLVNRYGANNTTFIRSLVSRVSGPGGSTLVNDILAASGDNRIAMISDLVNGQVSRDLNAYRGFAPAPSIAAKGLLLGRIGKTIRVKGDDSASHGIYVGAGPYVSVGTDMSFDQRLIDVLGSPTDVYLPNQQFTVGNVTETQLAAAITGGYRAHFQLPQFASTSERDGLYIAVNYNYLRGFRYDSANVGVRFDTDSQGLVTLQPSTTPAQVDHLFSQKGRGYSIDLATAVALDRWDMTFEAKGLGNRMEWDEVESERFSLGNLYDGLEFAQGPRVSRPGIIQVKLPVQYGGGVAFNADKWTADVELSRGLNRTEFHAGGEYRIGFIEVRGGERYSRNRWFPSGGFGVNLTRGFGIDFAAFRAATNIERQGQTSLAVSLRFNKNPNTN